MTASIRPFPPASVTPATLRVGRDEVLRFDQPVLLAAVSGSLWLTVDGKPDDIVLDPGMSRAFDGSARVLATPLGGEALIGVLPQAGHPAQPWLRRWQAFGRRVAGAPLPA